MTDLPSALDVGEQRARDAEAAEAARRAYFAEQRAAADRVIAIATEKRAASDRANAPDEALWEDELRDATRNCSWRARAMLDDWLRHECERDY